MCCLAVLLCGRSVGIGGDDTACNPPEIRPNRRHPNDYKQSGGVPSLEVTDIVVHTLSLDEVKGEKTDGSHKD